MASLLLSPRDGSESSYPYGVQSSPTAVCSFTRSSLLSSSDCDQADFSQGSSSVSTSPSPYSGPSSLAPSPSPSSFSSQARSSPNGNSAASRFNLFVSIPSFSLDDGNSENKPENYSVPRKELQKPFFPDMSNTSYFPALNDRNCEQPPRYHLLSTVIDSLYGIVKLAFDTLTRKMVCIKISYRKRAERGQAKVGGTVLENVKREARILKFLTGKANFLQASRRITSKSDRFPGSSCSPLQGNLAYPPRSSAASGPRDVADLSWEAAQGKQYVCQFVDELEDDFFHYLILEYCHRDLYDVLKSVEAQYSSQLEAMRCYGNQSLLSQMNSGRFSEEEGRAYFIQLLQAVCFLHSLHIVHMDISLENICLTEDGRIKLIDFGLALMHPCSSNQAFFGGNFNDAESSERRLELACGGFSHSEEAPFPPANACDPSSQFPCQVSSSSGSAKPGKVSYFSPEVFSGSSWDAYQNDCYSLGVNLYIFLTGKPPYRVPSVEDSWFACIYNGQWRTSSIRRQKAALETYGHLSEEALDLIDHLLKPASQRYGLKQIFEHPWIRWGRRS